MICSIPSRNLKLNSKYGWKYFVSYNRECDILNMETSWGRAVPSSGKDLLGSLLMQFGFHPQSKLRSSSIYKNIWCCLLFTNIVDAVFHSQKYLRLSSSHTILKGCPPFIKIMGRNTSPTAFNSRFYLSETWYYSY